MALFSKVGMHIADEAAKLPNRFTGGFSSMGAVKRPPRTNTTEELMASINAYAKENPEIAEFTKQMKDMNSQHLGLAQDIIDLSNIQELLSTNINLKQPSKISGKTNFGVILNMLPKVSKQNPAALDLTQAVINNSDTINSKYFLSKFFGFDLAKASVASEQIKAVEGMVPSIAKDTLSGGYTMDYSKNNEFFNFIMHLCSTDSKPENLKMLNSIIDSIEKFCKKTSPTCNLDDIRLGDTGAIKSNLKHLPNLLENAEAQGKNVDISGFLNKNINLD